MYGYPCTPMVATQGTLLVEAVIGPNSRLEGKTLKSARFRTLVGGTVHGIRHRGRMMRDHLEETVLHPGDVLLIEVPNKLVELLHGYQAFVIISEVNTPDFRRKKIPVALAIIGSVVASAAFGLVPILVGAIVGSVLMVLTRCLTLEEAYEAIQWKVVFLLGGVLALGLRDISESSKATISFSMGFPLVLSLYDFLPKHFLRTPRFRPKSPEILPESAASRYRGDACGLARDERSYLNLLPADLPRPANPQGISPAGESPPLYVR